MIDIAIIRENYSNMNDGQLMRTAREDGHLLTTEAFEILKEEFKKRNLDPYPIESAEQQKISIYQEKIQKIKDSNDEDFLKAIWKYILEEKENGTSDQIILNGLQERGLEEPHALSMMAGLKEKLQEVIKAFDTKMMSHAAIFIIGILVTLLTYSNALANGGYYVVAWGAILFGAVRFFTNLSEKGKYKRLLANIEKKDI